MEQLKDYTVLVRLVGEREADAIKSGDAEHIGSKPFATIVNTFDDYLKDENVAFCYPTEIKATSVEDARQRIEHNPSIITDEVGEGLAYMLKTKNENFSDNFSVMYFVMEPEKFDELVAMNKISTGVGFYENQYDEKMGIDEVTVKVDAMSTMYNPKCAGEFYAEDLVANGYLEDWGHFYNSPNDDRDYY